MPTKIPPSLLIASLLAITLVLPLAATAGPLSAFGDHTGEDHSFDNHRNENLQGIILADATLQSINFRDTVLQDAILTSADLTDAILRDAIFTNADLTNAILTDANARNADFSSANLTNATLTDLNARNVDFSNAVLNGVTFSTGEIRDASFVGASLLGADLSAVRNGNRADFTGAFYDAFTRLAPGIDTSTMTLVPEPSSAVLLMIGLIGLEICGRPSRRQAA